MEEQVLEAGLDRTRIKIRGLVQNRDIKDLTVNEIKNALKNTEYKFSEHAVERIMDPRTKGVGFNTLNDIAQIFNKGRVFDAGKGEIGFSYRGLEAIVDPKTKRVITIRPEKPRR
jgi:hypothetical protein